MKKQRRDGLTNFILQQARVRGFERKPSTGHKDQDSKESKLEQLRAMGMLCVALLKTSQALVTGHRGIKLVVTRKLHPCCVVFIMLECATLAVWRQGESSVK